MSLQDCAAAALTVFPNVTVQTSQGTLPLPVVMVAIAGAESGWRNDAAGDYGLPGPSCHGYTSWGLWQIHSVHSTYLQAVTGSADPCAWAEWLYDPMHNAEAALAIYQGQGLSAWTTYTGGQWTAYLPTAQQAVIAASSAAASSGTTTQASSVTSTAPVAIGGAAALLFGAAVAAIVAGAAEIGRAER